ncbi:MAG TPA: hypothetical protein VJM33_16950 [Microthrixaceae bacterium]|nr:hypothetical protein [Microthrixaceae bacterium]
MSEFVPAVLSAFEAVVGAVGLELVDTADDEWWASVEWRLDEVLLTVTDDRRDRLIEVFVTRPATPGERETASLLLHGETISLPLWAMVEAAGTAPSFALGGESRLNRLPEYALAVEEYAIPFVLDPDRPIDDIVAVVKQRNWESSDEGRRARRWLP